MEVSAAHRNHQGRDHKHLQMAFVETKPLGNQRPGHWLNSARRPHAIHGSNCGATLIIFRCQPWILARGRPSPVDPPRTLVVRLPFAAIPKRWRLEPDSLAQRLRLMHHALRADVLLDANFEQAFPLTVPWGREPYVGRRMHDW